MKKLYGKIIIGGKLRLLTGLHIGGSKDFAAIGMVDNVVIRDPITYQPIIPGSSIKGKMRYLAARVKSSDKEIPNIKNEPETIKRLFGGSKGKGGVILSRLQFYDLKISEDSLKKLKELDMDMPYTEVKFENTINRINGIANPRQIERVPAGTEFDFKLIYNVEDIEEELKADLKFLKQLIEVLENDYLGGHGTRGYGKVEFKGLKITELKDYTEKEEDKKKIPEGIEEAGFEIPLA